MICLRQDSTEVTNEVKRQQGVVYSVRRPINSKLAKVVPTDTWVRVIAGHQINVREEISMEAFEIPPTD